MSLKISKAPKLLTGAAGAGILSALLLGSTLAPVTPVLADAVKVEAPQGVNFADVVEAVSPAVVSVRVKAKARVSNDRGNFRNFRGFGFDDLPQDHPFRRFFDGPRGERQFGERNRRGKGQRRAPRRYGMSQGSGFFVSEDGYIVTNNHVVKGGTEFTVVTNDGDEIGATLVGTDPKTDLAVLKVDVDQKFTHVAFSKEKSRVGEWVVAVGNPFGLGGTVTAGIVSANGRDIGSGPYDDFIQIDAAVNKGNSGGPAFNLKGEVIGVNTAIFSPSGGNVGIAFAISADTAQEVVTDLIQNGSVTRGWLGVQIQPVTKDIATSLGMDKATGTLVVEAQADGPAAKAGLKSGDVILKVDNRSVKGPKRLARVIADYEPGADIKLDILRDGKEIKLDVELGTLKDRTKVATLEQDGSKTDSAIDLDDLGLSVAAKGNRVVVADVNPQSVASEKGIRAGDEIVSINGRDTRSVNDVGREIARAMEDDRKAVLLQIRNNQRSRFVALPVERG